MLNQVIMVGRLTRDVEVKENEDGKKYSTMTLAIPRSYKNTEGVYDTDFLVVVLFDSIASNTSEYCKKGDIVGVKGRVQSRVIENDESKEYKKEIIAEKVTFLSSKSKDENQENDKEQDDEMEM